MSFVCLCLVTGTCYWQDNGLGCIILFLETLHLSGVSNLEVLTRRLNLPLTEPCQLQSTLPSWWRFNKQKSGGGGEMSFFNGSSQHYMTSLCWIHTRMQSIFSWLCRMRISVFEVMSLYTSISKCYPKCNAAPWVEKCSTSREFHADDTRFYWSSENALHGHFITEQWCWVWMETLQLTAPHWKNA